MSKPKLTDADYHRTAKRLNCEVAAIKAVADTESRGKGFYDSGFPVILFERHKFRSFTRGKYNQSHPHLSGPAGGYGKAGQTQIDKFNEAFALNPIAAMKSCSWGKFQIMGFNHEVCGYATVGEFVDAMKESEGKQLDAFVEFVIGNGLGVHLRTKNWAKFANGYNGSSYRINKYDTKMATAYKRYSSGSAAGSIASAEAPPLSQASAGNSQKTDQPTVEQPSINQTADTIINTGDPAAAATSTKDVTMKAPEKDGATASATKTTILGLTVPPFVVLAIESIRGLVKDGYIDAKEVGSTVIRLITENQKYVFMLIGLFIVLLVVKKALKVITFWISMLTAAIPGWNTVTVVPTPVEGTPAKWWQIWK